MRFPYKFVVERLPTHTEDIFKPDSILIELLLW